MKEIIIANFSFHQKNDRLILDDVNSKKTPTGKTGIKVYKVWGWLLQLFGLSVKLKDKYKTWYVNPSSLQGWGQSNGQDKSFKIENLEILLTQMKQAQTLKTPPKPLPLPAVAGPAHINMNLDHELGDVKRIIDAIDDRASSIQKKKRPVFKLGMEHFKALDCKDEMATWRLENKDYEEINNPEYLNQKLNMGNSKLTTTPHFYDYIPLENRTNYWVDFSNKDLGGGALSHGFVQEEIMALRFPQLLNVIAANTKDIHSRCNIHTRIGGNDREKVGQGKASPWLFKNMQCVLDIKEIYGDKINKVDSLLPYVELLPKPQEAHILAIAAPKLPNENLKTQYSLATLKDLFVTLLAGFTLVKQDVSQQNLPPPLIHSGPLGCGVFHNNKKAVYLLHKLVGIHLEIDIQLHGYPEDYKQLWDKIANELPGKTLMESLQMISDQQPAV